jgi:hypothetical protein
VWPLARQLLCKLQSKPVQYFELIIRVLFPGAFSVFYATAAGALVDSFAMLAILHCLSMRRIGRRMWFRTVSGFFFLMGAGAALKHAFKVVTGRRVGGI